MIFGPYLILLSWLGFKYSINYPKRLVDEVMVILKPDLVGVSGWQKGRACRHLVRYDSMPMSWVPPINYLLQFF